MILLMVFRISAPIGESESAICVKGSVLYIIEYIDIYIQCIMYDIIYSIYIVIYYIYYIFIIYIIYNIYNMYYIYCIIYKYI